jgi:cytoplasmic iron level regulating protein YaaA (DUF328/UPF0246 family)
MIKLDYNLVRIDYKEWLIIRTKKISEYQGNEKGNTRKLKVVRKKTIPEQLKSFNLTYVYSLILKNANNTRIIKH